MEQDVTIIRVPLYCNHSLRQSAWQMLFSNAYRCTSQVAFIAAKQDLCVPSGFAVQLSVCAQHLAVRLELKYRICSEQSQTMHD